MAGEMAAQSKLAGVEQRRPHRRVEIGNGEPRREQIAVDVGKAGQVLIELGLPPVHGRIQHLEQPHEPEAQVGAVFAGPGLQQVQEDVARLEDAGVIGEQAEHHPHQEHLQVMADVTGLPERVMQPPHRRRGFDVDRVLIAEGSTLHAQDEAELLDVGGQVRQGERDAFALVEIMELEGLKVANQNVAGPFPLGQAIEILPGLPVGIFEVASLALLLDDQDARPEQVDEPGAVIQLLYMFFVARHGTPPYIENLEELVVEALCLTLLVGRVPPLGSECGSAGAHLIPGQAHGLKSLQGEMAPETYGSNSPAFRALLTK